MEKDNQLDGLNKSNSQIFQTLGTLEDQKQMLSNNLKLQEQKNLESYLKIYVLKVQTVKYQILQDFKLFKQEIDIALSEAQEKILKCLEKEQSNIQIFQKNIQHKLSQEMSTNNSEENNVIIKQLNNFPAYHPLSDSNKGNSNLYVYEIKEIINKSVRLLNENCESLLKMQTAVDIQSSLRIKKYQEQITSQDNICLQLHMENLKKQLQNEIKQSHGYHYSQLNPSEQTFDIQQLGEIKNEMLKKYEIYQIFLINEDQVLLSTKNKTILIYSLSHNRILHQINQNRFIPNSFLLIYQYKENAIPTNLNLENCFYRKLQSPEHSKSDSKLQKKYLAIGGSDLDPDIYLYDLENYEKIISFPGHSRGITIMKQLCDVNSLMAGSADGKIWIWDIQQAQPVLVKQAHTTQIVQMQTFMGQEQRYKQKEIQQFYNMITCSKDGKIMFWDLQHNNQGMFKGLELLKKMDTNYLSNNVYLSNHLVLMGLDEQGMANYKIKNQLLVYMQPKEGGNLDDNSKPMKPIFTIPIQDKIQQLLFIDFQDKLYIILLYQTKDIIEIYEIYTSEKQRYMQQEIEFQKQQEIKQQQRNMQSPQAYTLQELEQNQDQQLHQNEEQKPLYYRQIASYNIQLTANDSDLYKPVCQMIYDKQNNLIRLYHLNQIYQVINLFQITNLNL